MPKDKSVITTTEMTMSKNDGKQWVVSYASKVQAFKPK